MGTCKHESRLRTPFPTAFNSMAGSANAIGNGNAAMVNKIKDVPGWKAQLANNPNLKKLYIKMKGNRQLAGTNLNCAILFLNVHVYFLFFTFLQPSMPLGVMPILLGTTMLQW